MNSTTLQFIIKHADDDPLQLSLQAHRYPEVDMAMAVRQIASRKRIRTKLPQFYNELNVLYPVQLSLEQCSSEQTAVHKAKIAKGKSLVDLTGGFGVDFYYLAQNFESSTYVERQEELCALARHNFRVLGLQGYQVVNQSADDYIVSMPSVDWVYIDPHRRDASGHKTVHISDCEPDLTRMLPKLLINAKTVMVKLSPMLDLHKAIVDLPGTRQIDIVAVENECKELIFLLSSDQKQNNIKIRCFNYLKNNVVQQFELDESKNSLPIAYASVPLDYLYEPNAAILKSGAFNAIARHFNLHKFHPNTHLFTSTAYIPGFPGRIFNIRETKLLTKQTYRYLQQVYPAANISVRNFPMSVDELRKKAKLRDGGEWYIFAFKNAENQNLISICTKP